MIDNMDIINICETHMELMQLKDKLLKDCIEYIKEYLECHSGRYEFNGDELHKKNLSALVLVDGNPMYEFIGGYRCSIEDFFDVMLAVSICYLLKDK